MLESEELIIKFYDHIKVKYPDIPLEEINLICRAPFIFLRKMMALPSLPDIRFQYWGVFKVKGGRLNAIPKMTKVARKNGNVRASKVKSVDQIIKNYNLNSNKNDEQSQN